MRDGRSLRRIGIVSPSVRSLSADATPLTQVNSMQTFRLLALISIFGVGAAFPQQPDEETYAPDLPGASHAAEFLAAPSGGSESWLYPITEFNRHLPEWFQFGGQFRDRYEMAGHIGYGPVNDAYDLTQLRLGIYLRPSKWFEFVGVTQDSRVFFNHHERYQPPYQDTWNIREAYVRIGNETHGLADLVAGRQMFSFGDERVIGPSDWLNMGRTFDTVRLDVHPKDLDVSIFAASVINAVDGHIDHHIEGNNLYGIYSSFRKLVPQAVLEPYLLWRVAPGNVSLPETGEKGAMHEWTAGVRFAGTTPGDFDYDVEMNKQIGSLGHYTIDAWAGHWNVGRAFVHLPAKPRPFVEYNYATGNRNPQGNLWTTHDQIYPSSHDKMDFADQFGWRNIKDLRAGIVEKILSPLELMEVVDNLWLATRNDAVYAASGAISFPANPRATSNRLGTELELIGTLKPNPHVTYGFGFAHVFTGPFLNQSTPGRDYNYPFTYLTYIF